MLKVRQMKKNLEKYHLHYEEGMFRKGSDIANLFDLLYTTHSTGWNNILFFVFDKQERRIIKPSEFRKNKPFKRFLSNLHHYGKFLEKNPGIDSLSFNNHQTRIAFIRIMFRESDAESKQYIQFAFLTPQSLESVEGEIRDFNCKFNYKLWNSDSDITSEMFLYYPDSQTIKTMNYFTESGVEKKTLDELSISESLDFTDNLELLSKMSDDFMFIKEFHDEQISYTSLTYTDILQGGKTRKEILLNKWKTLNKLDGLINLNKYSVDEINLLRELQNKLTKQDFLRTINWYTQSKWHKNKEFRLKHLWHYDSQFTWRMIYFEATFKNALNGKLYYEIDEKGYEIDEKGVNFDKVDQARRALMTFNDYLVLFKLIHPHKKYQIPFKSFKRLHEEEQKLIKLDNQKRYATFKKPFYQAKKWDKLKQNVANSDLNIKILDSVDKLVTEGNEQHNCIGDVYVEPAYQNECVILDYIDPKNDRYSIEVRYDNEFQDYYIEQCLLKYNEVGDSSIPQQIEQLLNK